MESKHKNALIGALLAVVFVMAVGYAALSQTLTITGTATVTDQSQNWNVHFNEEKTSGSGVVDTVTGTGGTVNPSGTIQFSDNNHTATLDATLIQPGDSVTFTLTIENEGSITADLNDLVITPTDGGGSLVGNTVTAGNITFDVTNPSQTTIAQGETATVTVKATFKDTATEVGAVTTAGISVTMNAEQATA